MDELFNKGKIKIFLVNLQYYLPELQMPSMQNNFLESATAEFK